MSEDTFVESGPEIPDRIGPYRILQLIGEGGMGEVYLAEQTEPVQRRVALKIIKLGMDTKEIVARFQSERQALAVMDHPYIARVYDAGATERGRPYFVMELVTGVPLTEYCDTHKLSTEERIELFLKVCEGILHAHQKGIVHRDLKPSNILISEQSGKPVPKIIDFGIAKAMGRSLTDRTFVTAMGLPIGTPAYMSPEQADMSSLDIDTRADIYTLGVILYELLTGSLPHDLSTVTGDPVALRKQLRETDPPTPSTRVGSLGEEASKVAERRNTSPAHLKRELRGDLDWIVMKAMEKDRTRRYETVNALTREIQRYLNHEPVEARAPTIPYRVSKFVRRYRGWVAAAAVGVSGLTVGLGTAVFQWRQAESARERALANLNLAIESVDEMLVAAGDTLAFANEPVLEEIREELFAKARDFYEEFNAQTSEPEYRLATAMASQRLGDVYGLTGEVSRAEDAYRRAIDSLTVLTEEFPDRLRYRDLLAVSYNWLGLNLAPRDRPAARSAYDTALSIADALVEEAPDESEFRRHRARTLYNRGILLAGDTATQSDAEADYRAAIDDLEALVAGASGRGSDPGDPVDEYRRELARSHNNLANLLRITGRESEALRSFERAIALLDDVSERTDLRGPKQELAVYHNNLANFHWERGEDDRAVVRSQEALALFEELAAPLASLDLERASSYSTLGIILLDQGRLEQAESALRSSLSIWERLEASSESLTRDPVFQYRFGFTLFDLAQASLQRGDTAEASRHLGRALDHHLATLRAVEGDSPMTDLCYAYEDLAGRFGGDTGSRPGDGAAGSPESRPEDGPGGDATAEISRTVAQALEACAAG